MMKILRKICSTTCKMLRVICKIILCVFFAIIAIAFDIIGYSIVVIIVFIFYNFYLFAVDLKLISFSKIVEDMEYPEFCKILIKDIIIECKK